MTLTMQQTLDAAIEKAGLTLPIEALKLFNIIKDSPGFTARELSLLINGDSQKIATILSSMENRGMVYSKKEYSTVSNGHKRFINHYFAAIEIFDIFPMPTKDMAPDALNVKDKSYTSRKISRDTAIFESGKPIFDLLKLTPQLNYFTIAKKLKMNKSTISSICSLMETRKIITSKRIRAKLPNGGVRLIKHYSVALNEFKLLNNPPKNAVGTKHSDSVSPEPVSTQLESPVVFKPLPVIVETITHVPKEQSNNIKLINILDSLKLSEIKQLGVMIQKLNLGE